MVGRPALLFAVLLLGADVAASPLPWKPRQPPAKPPGTHQLRDPGHWPPEPTVDDPVDPGRFREALAYVCKRPAEKVYADDLLTAATEAGVDPFLLGGLMVEQSGCNPRPKRTRWQKKAHVGIGLLGVDPTLYRAPDAPAPPVPRAELSRKALLDPVKNLSVGARLLRMWLAGHEEIDEAFGGTAHRSGVAHFQWGDRVRSSGGEDLVFTARRRLVSHYKREPDRRQMTSLGLEVVSPLEGVPRVASSGPGEDREGGARRHRGIDIVAVEGEPVRAIADGVVIFAGANVRGNPRRGAIPPAKIARYARRRLGPGGIYVCVRHDDPATGGKEIVSCYMHLASYVVAHEARVTAGQTIGFVGRTGVRVSPPHLHFELRVNDRAMNPVRYLSELVIPPKATLTHRYVVAAKRAKIRAARAAARAARAATETSGGL